MVCRRYWIIADPRALDFECRAQQAAKRQSCKSLAGKTVAASHKMPHLTAPRCCSAALHGTFGYFSDGMPLAYLLATVVTGLGLLIGSMIHVSQSSTYDEGLATSGARGAERKVECVGRVTGTALDCVWSAGSRICLGQKCELASGRLEITYRTEPR